MRQTILLADDSPTIQRLVAQTFAEGNYEVISVSNGEAAIRRLEEIKPAVVLADIYMPGRSGYEVCAYVRAHYLLSSTPVILLVGAFDAFDEETANRAGASANITKPFEPRALIELVQSVIARGGSAEAKTETEAKAEPKQPGPPKEKEERKEIEFPAKSAVMAQTAPAAKPPTTPAPAAAPTETDILGLSNIFARESTRPAAVEMAEADIERIAERVMKKLSRQAVESIAWDVVPEIAEKVLRDSLKQKE
jgi:CheY-like chemotaxis protein